MSSREYKELEKLQSKAIQMLYGTSQSTPYWGMSFELVINPLEYEVHYNKLMLYHNLENSSDKRVAKRSRKKTNITRQIASTVKYSRVLKR